jgi:hypothetical protein
MAKEILSGLKSKIDILTAGAMTGSAKMEAVPSN